MISPSYWKAEYLQQTILICFLNADPEGQAAFRRIHPPPIVFLEVRGLVSPFLSSSLIHILSNQLCFLTWLGFSGLFWCLLDFDRCDQNYLMTRQPRACPPKQRTCPYSVGTDALILANFTWGALQNALQSHFSFCLGADGGESLLT